MPAEPALAACAPEANPILSLEADRTAAMATAWLEVAVLAVSLEAEHMTAVATAWLEVPGLRILPTDFER